MDYPQTFSDVLTLADSIGETYIGHGNPLAPVLIVANEPGTVSEWQLTNDFSKNLERWKKNKDCLLGIEDVACAFDDNNNLLADRFNPLYPYRGQRYVKVRWPKDDKKHEGEPVNKEKRPTSYSWKQYQKLIDIIFRPGYIRNSSDNLDFFSQSFITDFSSACALKSSQVDKSVRGKSIHNRLNLFRTPFFNSFPVTIVAAGHYIDGIKELNDLTTVFPRYRYMGLIKNSLGWLNIHYRDDGEGILIHCKHFASCISDDYLKFIARFATPFVNNRRLPRHL